MMKNMRVKQKLVISFLIVAAVTAIVGVVGVAGLLTLDANEDTLYKLNVNGTYAKTL